MSKFCPENAFITFIFIIVGVLYARISFDREKNKLYEVPIAAFDGGGRPGYSSVRISVTNENDNAPLFTVSDYRAYVYENTTMGTTVLQVLLNLFIIIIIIIMFKYMFNIYFKSKI